MKPAFKVNKKAPRMSKKEFSTHVITLEAFERFKQEFPEYKDMKWKYFNDRWLELAEVIRKEGVMNPLGVKLGSYLGELKLQFLPYKLEAVDIKSSMDEGEKVKYLNILTRGKVGKMIWCRRWAVRFNKMLQFYGFEPHREMIEISKKYIPENIDKIRIARNTLGGKRTWR